MTQSSLPGDVARPDLAGRQVALIGLGLMGQPMARALRRAGAAVTVSTRSAAPLQAFAAEGFVTAATPAQAAAQADAVILMLTDTPAVDSVTTALLTADLAGKLIIDMGTTAPQATRRLAAQVAAAGAAWVDAPVSGGQVGAEQATLTIMAGGDDAAFARALPLLQAMGRHITHVGGCGAGQVAKAANQVIVGLTIGAVAEAMALARSAGVDPARLREALMGGFAASRILDLHGLRMAEGRFQPGGRSVTQRKDLQQALDLAQDHALDLPVTRLIRDLYDRLIDAGGGDLDHSGLYTLYAGAPASGVSASGVSGPDEQN